MILLFRVDCFFYVIYFQIILNLGETKMAVAIVHGKMCVLCETILESDLSAISVSSEHTLFPSYASVRSALKSLMLRGIENVESSLVDSILHDESFICSSCLEKTATCVELQRRIESAEHLMKFTLREGLKLMNLVI